MEVVVGGDAEVFRFDAVHASPELRDAVFGAEACLEDGTYSLSDVGEEVPAAEIPHEFAKLFEEQALRTRLSSVFDMRDVTTYSFYPGASLCRRNWTLPKGRGMLVCLGRRATLLFSRNGCTLRVLATTGTAVLLDAATCAHGLESVPVDSGEECGAHHWVWFRTV
jgi:hypothetical protein